MEVRKPFQSAFCQVSTVRRACSLVDYDLSRILKPYFLLSGVVNSVQLALRMKQDQIVTSICMFRKKKS
jgi:hypothetical protein